jgi:hypothetical protein
LSNSNLNELIQWPKIREGGYFDSLKTGKGRVKK